MFVGHLKLEHLPSLNDNYFSCCAISMKNKTLDDSSDVFMQHCGKITYNTTVNFTILDGHE